MLSPRTQFFLSTFFILALGAPSGAAQSDTAQSETATSPAEVPNSVGVEAKPASGDPVEEEGALEKLRWNLDVADAPSQALMSQRLVLYAFTGSDWSSETKSWFAITLGQQEFLQSAKSKYHLVQVDFPKSTEASARVKDTSVNTRLAGKFDVRDFPALVVADPQGNVLATHAWTSANSDELLAELARRIEATHALLALVESWSVGLAECEELDQDCRLGQYQLAKSYLLDHPTSCVSADPAYRFLEGVFELEGEPAKALQYEALHGFFSAGRVNLHSLQMAASVDPRNVDGLFEQFLVGAYPGIVVGREAVVFSELLVRFKEQSVRIQDPAMLAEIAAGVARWCLAANQINHRPRAILLAAWSFELDEDVAKEARANRILDMATLEPK